MENPLSIRRYHQELANTLTHGFGFLLGIICIPILIAMAVKGENVAGTVGIAIYGFTFLMAYAASTLYHGIQQKKWKYALKVLDHISIYFLIAGSYTPFILLYVYNFKGITLLCVLWGLTLLGIIFKIFFTGRFNLFSTLIYVFMGWLALSVIGDLISNMPTSVLTLVTIGGVIYTLGTIFYLWEKPKYNHAIWHLFVLGGSICHYVAVLLSVL